MITHQVINLLEAPVHGIAHQANCFHTFGAGVARQIRLKYPEAYEADLKTEKGSHAKLGGFSSCTAHDEKLIFNVYSQYDTSHGGRATLYDMVDKGLRTIEARFSPEQPGEKFILGIPYKYGSALGGGSWRVVEAIIRDIFEPSTMDVILCEWPAPITQNNLTNSVQSIRFY